MTIRIGHCLLLLALFSTDLTVLAQTKAPAQRNDQPVAVHAVLVDAAPGSDSTIPGPDVDVKLRFNLRIDHARSRLTLVFPDGKTIALNISDYDTPDWLVARATGLGRGSYRLRWQVLAVDGHITRGELLFHVSGS
jgi:copper resistance protein C